MNPSKVKREQMSKLTDLPNIGKAGAADLELLGINEPGDLKGLDPYDMYERLCTFYCKKYCKKARPLCHRCVYISDFFYQWRRAKALVEFHRRA